MKKFLLSLFIAGVAVTPAFALQPDAPVVKVQATSDQGYRISVLEEQVRQLNGKIEELNFQLLELQELIRRLQEDNEFRFQELEQKGSLSGGSNDLATSDTTINTDTDSLEKPEPSEPTNNVASGGNQNQSTQTIDGVEIYSGEPGVESAGEQTLGTIQFDENGNIVDSAIGKPLDLTASLNNPQAGLPDQPDELFDLGFNYVQSGRYEDAERALVKFSDQHSSHPRLPEARFWLGESHLGRGQYQEAAKVYLDAHKRWPNGKFGPQSLLKLGVAVAGLNQRELACATFAEVLQKYPSASRAVKRNVAFEQRAAKCALN